MESTPGSVGAGSEMGAGSRLLNVFFSPSKVFESIARKRGRDWMVPVAILILLGIAGAILVSPKLDVDEAVRVQMQRMEKVRTGMTDADRTKIEEAIRGQMTKMTQGPIRFVWSVLFLVPLFLVPAFYHGIAAAWGKSTSYLSVVAGYAYVQMVQALKGVLLVAVAAPRKSISILEVETLLKSNLGALMNPETASRPLYSLALNVDLFEIWAIVVGVIALSRITRLTPKASALTVGGLWVVWVCIKMIGALIGAAFGG
ncbi:MAG: YIP1 family protein [Acidobacteriia bacterium]|nr:YIP1 family protein [Terriglobia bacterium]